MLEHQMRILKAVADNDELFKKEMMKTLTWLNFREKDKFCRWLNENYPKHYHDLNEEVS